MSRLQNALGVSRSYAIGLVAMVLLAVLCVTNYTGALRGLFKTEGPEIRATFANTATLMKGDPVRVRGVQVGEVKEIEPLPGAGASRVTMTLADEAGPLYGDARARVRWRSLLGGAFTVEIDPGTERSGRLAGQSIPASRTETQVELDDVTEIALGDAQTGLRIMPGELGAAMDDPAAAAELFDTLADVAPAVTDGVGGLRGQLVDKDLRELVASAADTMDTLNDPGNLRAVVEGAATLVQTTAAREADIRQLLQRSPAVMANTNLTLDRLRSTLDLADPVVDGLTGPAGELGPALAALRPVAVDADRLLDDARPLLRDLRPAVTSLAATGRQGVPLLRALAPTLRRVDEQILPYMAEKNESNGHSMAEMIGPGAGGLAMVAAQLDKNGHFLRFPATAGSSSAYLPCQTYIANPDKDTFIECRNFEEYIDELLTYDPFTGTGAERASAKEGGTK